jgi:hypothetical protein
MRPYLLRKEAMQYNRGNGRFEDEGDDVVKAAAFGKLSVHCNSMQDKSSLQVTIKVGTSHSHSKAPKAHD